MKHLMATAALVALLAGCNGTSPFIDDDADTDTGTDPVVDPVTDPDVNDILETGTRRPNPDAPAPTSDDGIARLEARDGTGGGLVASVRYVAASDSFIVDGLGFDGANTYARGTTVGQLGDYAVFEANVVATDPITGDPIGQIVPYRAIYGVSDNSVAGGDPRTAFAIVRTGGYVDFGFGGFLYERNGTVTLPDSGQAIFSGDYAGIRVSDPRATLEYTTGDVEIAVDFEDFNANDAVRGRIDNRRAFDDNGNEIVLGLTEDSLVLPTISFGIQEGAPSLLTNGELGGNLASYTEEDGALQVYEEGTYYAVVAGDVTGGDGGEIVGVFVVESEDPRFSGVTVQETGGFILYRGTGN